MSKSVIHRNALPQGARLEEYVIEGVLGKPGGFGIVYLARDNLDQQVAIKEYLPNELAMREGATVYPKSTHDDEDFEWGLAGFLDEAKTLARFNRFHHPNIVQVLRYFTANGTAYMVMPYEDGAALDGILERNNLTEEELLKNVLLPLLDGLKKVHGEGFLHRDIKPGNIYMRRSDESPILIDFGAARDALGRKSKSITSIVTEGYAPFEQYQSRGNQGPWSDIYALGAVAYKIVSGERPPLATDRIRKDPMTPAVEAGGKCYSLELLKAIDHALAVDEEDRPQSCEEWKLELTAGSVFLKDACLSNKLGVSEDSYIEEDALSQDKIAVRIGVDLGDSFSSVSVFENQQPMIIANQQGYKSIPSVVAFTDNGEIVVGEAAKNLTLTNDGNVIFSIKQLIGKQFSDLVGQRGEVPYQLFRGENDEIEIYAHGKQYSVAEVIAEIIGELKRTAERYLGGRVSNAVITAPEYFDDVQKTVIRSAARISGLHDVRVISDTSAMALAYMHSMPDEESRTVAFCDVGSSGFSYAVANIGDGVAEIISTNSGDCLSGTNIDDMLVDWIKSEFYSEHRIHLSNDHMTIFRLKDAASKARECLSSQFKAVIELPYIFSNQSGMKHLKRTFSRADFGKMLAGLQPIPVVKNGGESYEPDIWFFSGGLMRMPILKEYVRQQFSISAEYRSMYHRDSVVFGAALQAAIIVGDLEGYLLLDVTSHSYGIEDADGRMIQFIRRNSTIPTKKTVSISPIVANQKIMEIHLRQGEMDMASENRSLKHLYFVIGSGYGSELARVDVTLGIDASGNSNIDAVNQETGESLRLVHQDDGSEAHYGNEFIGRTGDMGIREFGQKKSQSSRSPGSGRIGDEWINPVDNSTMLFVPEGVFTMGAEASEINSFFERNDLPVHEAHNFYDETPSRNVSLSGFWISKYAITNGQFSKFLTETNAINTIPEHEAGEDIMYRGEFGEFRRSKKDEYARIINNRDGVDYPVSGITYYEAKKYAQWTKSSLPTEAEWEKAARGTDKRAFSWGDDYLPALLNSIEESHPCPDGIKVYENEASKSPYGCIQMCGNVGEWCEDSYDEKHYQVMPDNNPLNASSGEYRVIRGGGTHQLMVFCRTSSRNFGEPDTRPDFVGFRTVIRVG